MNILLLAVGVYIVVEGAISIWWAYNDKSWYAQGVRISRVISGGLIVCLVLLGNIGLSF